MSQHILKSRKPAGKPVANKPESDRSFMLRFLREAGTKRLPSEDVKRFTLLAFTKDDYRYQGVAGDALDDSKHEAVDRTADVHIPMEDPTILISAFAKFLDSRSDTDRQAVESWMWRYGMRDKE